MQLIKGHSIEKKDLLGPIAPVHLPADYMDFMKSNNGLEGLIGDHYLLLWPLEWQKSINQLYGYLDNGQPDSFWIFGSNGSDAAFAFDLADEGRILEIPYVSLYPNESTVIAENFSQFLDKYVGTSLLGVKDAEIGEISGVQLHRIKPLKFGGSPTDPANVQRLSPEKHAEVSKWWYEKLKEVRK